MQAAALYGGRTRTAAIPADRPIKPVYIRRLVAFVDRVLESQE